MPTTPNYQLPYPVDQDPATVPNDLDELATATDLAIKGVSDRIPTIPSIPPALGFWHYPFSGQGDFGVVEGTPIMAPWTITFPTVVGRYYSLFADLPIDGYYYTQNGVDVGQIYGLAWDGAVWLSRTARIRVIAEYAHDNLVMSGVKAGDGANHTFGVWLQANPPGAAYIVNNGITWPTLTVTEGIAR